MVSIGFRKQRSHRHFVGTVEQKNRERDRTEIVNDVYLWDIGLTYNFTPRTSLSVSVPVQHATRVSPARFNSAGVQTQPKAVSHGIGVGDMSIGAKVWLLDPGRENRPRQNISFGFGVKLPTGNEGYEYHLLAMALSAVVMIAGSGALSVDAWLTRRAHLEEGRWSRALARAA